MTLPEKILGFLESNPRQPGYTVREIGAGLAIPLDDTSKLQSLRTTCYRLVAQGRLDHSTQIEPVKQRMRNDTIQEREHIVARYAHPDWDLA